MENNEQMNQNQNQNQNQTAEEMLMEMKKTMVPRTELEASEERYKNLVRGIATGQYDRNQEEEPEGPDVEQITKDCDAKIRSLEHTGTSNSVKVIEAALAYADKCKAEGKPSPFTSESHPETAERTEAALRDALAQGKDVQSVVSAFAACLRD